MTGYRRFEIETLEVGRGQWHARLRKDDQKPIVIDGIPFDYINLGIAWPTAEQAIADARQYIDKH